MRKLIVMIPLASSIILLSGCSGDMLSPSNYQTATHTTTTTTTRANTAELELSNNSSTCTGLIVMNSCNNTLANAQSTEAEAIVPAPAPIEDTAPTFGDVVEYLLVAIGCIFWFCVLLWLLGKAFGQESFH